MWYSHYFNSNKLNEEQKEFVDNSFREILEQIDIENGMNLYELSLDYPWENWVSEELFEENFNEIWFNFDKISITNQNFIKTARKRYDLAVFLSSILIAIINKDEVKCDWWSFEYDDITLDNFEDMIKKYISKELSYTKDEPYNLDKILPLFRSQLEELL